MDRLALCEDLPVVLILLCEETSLLGHQRQYSVMSDRLPVIQVSKLWRVTAHERKWGTPWRMCLWVMVTTFLVLWWMPALATETRLLLGPLPDKVGETGLPHGWQPLNFHDIEAQTEYTVGMDGDGYALKAVSEASSSGIYTEVDLDAGEYQYLSWAWKVGNLIENGDAMRKSGDDFPARIIIAFDYQHNRASFFKRIQYEIIRIIYGRYPPGSALVYVWDNKLPVGTTLDNASTSWAKMIVMESGPSKVGQWVAERRNFYEDYQRVFGESPTRLKFIGIMTDTDDTGERAVAYFRQFSLESR